MEHMRKLIPFLLAGGIVLCAASCKEEKKTEDIITRIPPKKVVKKGTGKMSDFTYEKQVEVFNIFFCVSSAFVDILFVSSKVLSKNITVLYSTVIF